MSTWEWILTGGVGVDWFIGLTALGCLLCAAVLTHRLYKKDDSDV